ncbi:hypothetical protein A9Q98_13305 [Thalassotalea sp. 42_200_T64]|nr:hypothetical protein A9Q98_13305 [Thalassotalea sp. 42_200_T64]
MNEVKVLTTDITIPDTAVIKPIIMRVMVAYNDAASDNGSCTTLDSGEFEDYTIVVKTASANETENALLYFLNSLSEVFLNDGNIVNRSVEVSTYKDAKFAKATSTLEEGTDFRFSNLPEGITPVITINSNQSASLVFTGAATHHELANNTSATLTWLNPAVEWGTNAIKTATQDFDFDFIDAYKILTTPPHKLKIVIISLYLT